MKEVAELPLLFKLSDKLSLQLYRDYLSFAY